MVQVESSWLGSRFPSATASPILFSMKEESPWKQFLTGLNLPIKQPPVVPETQKVSTHVGAAKSARSR